MGPKGKGKAKEPASAQDEDQHQSLIESLTNLFAVAHPFPNPLEDESLIPTDDIGLEQDLLLNSSNPKSWNAYINHIIASNRPSEREPLFRDADVQYSEKEVKLLGSLASNSNRLGLKRITFAYERAISTFPSDYNLWKNYLLLRMRYILGDPNGSLDGFWKRQIQSGKEKLDAGPSLLDDKENGQHEWDWGLATGATGPLDGRIGFKEWHNLAALFERSLMHLPRMPRIWQLYFTMLMHPSCPSTLSFTHTRRTFDRALRTLPPSLHLRVWKYYLRWAETRGSETCIRIWRRYLRVDPSLTERYVRTLERLREEQDEEEEEEEEGDSDAQNISIKEQRALEAVKLSLRLAKDSIDGKYTSPEGKSSLQLLTGWLSLCEKYAEEIGLDPEEDEKNNLKMQNLPTSFIDPSNPSKIPVAHIVRTLGLERFPDQAGRLWTGLATYWIRRGDIDTAKATFEEGMKAVMTVRDFTQIFDAYAETCENVIQFMMDDLGQETNDEDEQEEKESEIDEKMKEFEELMERRPFLVNDVMIRRNPNDIQEWEKRISLFGDDEEKVIETYNDAIRTVNPRKATANLHTLYINYARFYEKGLMNLESAREILEKATTVPFTRVDDLAEVWCEWAEMEVRNSNFEGALRIMSRATAAPKTGAAIKAVNFLDDSLTAQKRLFKSSKLWSFNIDLEEGIGSIESARETYDRMIELKIATPQVIINYARFLEEHKYFEESFRVYERGVESFTYPVAFEIWNIYLSKFVKRYGASKLERARDMFEQALEKCPDKYCRPLFLMYGKLEEDYGLAKRAMLIYERATERVLPQDKFNMYVFYIAKVAANFGLPATRPVYERAIETLPDRQTAEMCVRFAQLERKLGEIDRARALYAHASQFCDPRTQKEFWSQWNAFEIEHGSEDTFREMLRIRRSVQAQFNTDTSFIAAYASAQQKANDEARAVQIDPMAQLEVDAVTTSRNINSAAPMFVAAKQNVTSAVPSTKNSEVLSGGNNKGNGVDQENQDDDSDLM